MNEKSMWMGFGLGLITASILFAIGTINNDYVDMLPPSMFSATSAFVPYYINIYFLMVMTITVGTLILIAFLLSHYTTPEEEI